MIARVDHDALGHGLLPVARAFATAGADWLCVADFDEAALVREAGISLPLLALRPSGAAIDEREVHCAVGGPDEAQLARQRGAAGVHPIIDCGDASRGIGWGDVEALRSIGKVAPVTGLMGIYGPQVLPSHADEAFAAAVSEIGDAPTHLHGTRGVEAGAPGGSAVRIGRGLYGIPGRDGSSARAALSLSGRIVTVKEITKGEGVSYGYAYRAPADGRIALVTGGYGDGIYRAAGNHANVVVAGMIRPIVGRVAMDVCVVNLDDVPAEPGDEVVFFGDAADGAPSLSDWAQATGLSALEIVSTLSPRVVRRYEQ
jgi:alanine racemase